MKRTFPDWFMNEIANDEDKKKAIENNLKLNDKIEFIKKRARKPTRL